MAITWVRGKADSSIAAIRGQIGFLRPNMDEVNRLIFPFGSSNAAATEYDIIDPVYDVDAAIRRINERRASDGRTFFIDMGKDLSVTPPAAVLAAIGPATMISRQFKEFLAGLATANFDLKSWFGWLTDIIIESKERKVVRYTPKADPVAAYRAAEDNLKVVEDQVTQLDSFKIEAKSIIDNAMDEYIAADTEKKQAARDLQDFAMAVDFIDGYISAYTKKLSASLSTPQPYFTDLNSATYKCSACAYELLNKTMVYCPVCKVEITWPS